MSSVYGPDGHTNESEKAAPAPRPSLECQLFESLVHHLVEKGVLTKNDALSVVQTVAEVRRGALEKRPRPDPADNSLAILKRLYSSFEIMSEGSPGSPTSDDENVVQLRPPLHGNRPKFSDDN